MKSTSFCSATSLIHFVLAFSALVLASSASVDGQLRSSSAQADGNVLVQDGKETTTTTTALRTRRVTLTLATSSTEEKKSVHEIIEQSMQPQPRIVGGLPSAVGDFPWYVAPSGSDSGALCGASLIHSNVVLTAAHCRHAFAVGTPVAVGATELNGRSNNVGSKGGISNTVAALLVHPDYNDDTVVNDFMLVQLETPITSVTPIELNHDDAIPAVDQRLTAMGFGLTKEIGFASEELLHVDIFAVHHDTCQDQYQLATTMNANIQNEIMFCAGVPGGGQDTCSGDSGGPIVMADANGRYKQVGVVSFGFGCARAGYPGVNARVSSVIDWIHQGVCALSLSLSSSKADARRFCQQGEPAATAPRQDDGGQLPQRAQIP